eukprot:Gb_14360 [translate_table: standard]
MGCIHAKSSKGFKKQKGNVRAGASREYGELAGEFDGQEKLGDVDCDAVDRQSSVYDALDLDVGVPRLSRLSAQFLPPSGSRFARVPACNYELKFSYLSQRGYYPEALDKANQDSFCIHTQFGKDTNDHFFGVFDGHGEFGTQCSQFVKKNLCENLLRDREFRTDAVQAYHSAFMATNTQLHRHSIDDSMSGTTAITVLVRGSKLYVANVGDSRAVIAEKRGKDLVAVDLSNDQTPFRADECARVRSCGARVLTLDQLEGLKNPDVQCWEGEEDDDGDPPRLWVPSGMYPGTAFTRSVGDTIAENIGVSAVPEVLVMELTPNHPFFVIASDGVFEFLSSQAVIDMVAKFKDPRDACAAIVAESYRLWLQYETRTDDITIIVVQIHGLQDSGTTKVDNDVNTKPVQKVLTEGSNGSSLCTGGCAKNSRPARHDLSRARLRAIESSLENGPVWVSPTLSYRKTPEEIADIERALQGNFLFNKLTEAQCRMVYECMELVQVSAGDVVIRQGGEGDCFYIVQKGEFDVLISQEGKPAEELGTVVHRYSAGNFSCFGELALMYNKPRQASVRAVTDGSLWALKREDFRGILLVEFTNSATLKILRSIEVLAKLTLLQLNRLAGALSEVSFMDGEKIVDKYESLSALYIVQQGEVKLIYHSELDLESATWKMLPHDTEWEDLNEGQKCLRKKEGSYFGEWTVLGEQIGALTAIASGDVVCRIITKEKFDSVVGPLQRIIQDDLLMRDHVTGLRKEHMPDINTTDFSNVQLQELEWQTTVYATECCEIGLVLKKGSENVLSLKRFSKKKIKQLGCELQVFKEKALMKSLSPSLFVPQVLCTCANHEYAAILLNACLAGPLAAILHAPLKESSARYISASVVVALELMHKDGVVYRGVSPDILMVDQKGHLQLVDFRFAKKLSDERTFTICGMADYLAPEIIQGKGHGLSADWWALGVLIYFMLQSELPFGSWRESDLDIFAKIARGQLMFPCHFSLEVIDLLKKLLEVDENVRLGCKGADSVKNHPWFKGMDWNGFLERCVPVPEEILSRIDSAFELHYADEHPLSVLSSTADLEDLNTQEWLDEW